MKKRRTGRDDGANGNEGDDEGFESSPEKVYDQMNEEKIILTSTFSNVCYS